MDMNLKIHPVLLKHMLEKWEFSRTAWENNLSRLAGTEIRLPHFFWQMETPVRLQKFPETLTVDCPEINGWLQVYFRAAASHELELRLMNALSSEFLPENRRAG